MIEASADALVFSEMSQRHSGSRYETVRLGVAAQIAPRCLAVPTGRPEGSWSGESGRSHR